MPLPSLLGADVSRAPYAPFDDIPSYDNSTGKPAQYCGPLANQLCGNYADQLYWLTRDYRFGSSTLEAPLVGATFTNIDLSWAHEFRDGSAFKITPFYRRGYNVIEQTAQDHRLQLPNRLAGLRRRSVLESGHSESDRHRDALHQGIAARRFDADRRDLHQLSSATSRPGRFYSRRRWHSVKSTARPISRRFSSTPLSTGRTPTAGASIRSSTPTPVIRTVRATTRPSTATAFR